jgi:hypothetical protein
VRRRAGGAGQALTFLVAAAGGAISVLTLSIPPAAAQYEESLDIFPNPERGWIWDSGIHWLGSQIGSR